MALNSFWEKIKRNEEEQRRIKLMKCLYLFGLIFLFNLMMNCAEGIGGVDSHGQSMNNMVATWSGEKGVIIDSNIDGYINNITKASGTDAISVSIKNFPANTTLANATFSGNLAIFDSTAIISKGNRYLLITINDTGNYNNNYSIGTSFPINNVGINWTKGWNGGGVSGDVIGGIISIGTSESPSSYTTLPIIIQNMPNNTIINSSSNLNIMYNITNYGANITNVTLIVKDMDGVTIATNSTLLNSINNVTGNLTIEMNNYGQFAYKFGAYYNYSGNMSYNESEIRYFKNGAVFKVVNTEGNLISDGNIIINGNTYLTNRKEYASSIINNWYNTSFSVTGLSIGNLYTQNSTTINVNLSKSYLYNVTLDSYKLNLFFFYENGTSRNISGEISDLTKIITFSNISYLKDQAELDNDMIYIRIINGSIGGNWSWDNKSQYFEYDNSLPYSIYENITIISDIDTSSYFQTQDNAGNIIKNAKIRLYGAKPSFLHLVESEMKFYGQRITDDMGKTVFPLNSQMEVILIVTADGYETKTVRFTASEITTFEETNPKLIIMKRNGLTTKDNLFIGGLYKSNGGYIYGSDFDDVSKNYLLLIYDGYKRDLKYHTNYLLDNNTINLDNTNGGIIYLNSGEHFDDSINSSFLLYIYTDDLLTYTLNITYNGEGGNTFINIEEDAGIKDVWAWKLICFCILIFISSFIAIFFETGDQDAGVHTFFLGSFILPIVVSGMGWITFVAGTFYLGKLTKRWWSE